VTSGKSNAGATRSMRERTEAGKRWARTFARTRGHSIDKQPQSWCFLSCSP
jgi:hypothetical protein